MSTSRQDARRRRHRRVRKKVTGTAARPRLAVFRSNKYIYVQAVDDEAGRTIAAASSREAALRDDRPGTVEAARRVGELVGERLRTEGVERAVFDRGGFRFHGRVAAVAEGARSAGIEF